MPAAFLASGNLLASTSIRRHLAPAPSALAALAAAPRCTPDVLPLRHAQSYLLPLLAGALQQQLDSNQMERKPVQTSPPADLPLQACNAGKQQQHWVQHWLRRQQACHALQQQPYPPQQQLQHLRSLATRSIPYVDRVRMEVQGGAGGNGCVSYTQVARGRRQAATGGNGGDGGDVVLRATKGGRELRGLPRVVRGEAGGHGRPNGRTGSHGRTRVVDVPVGMVVSVLEDVPSVAPALDGPDDAAESTAVAATTQQSWQWDVDPPSHGSSGGGDSGSSSSSSSSSSSVRGCSGSGGSGSKRSSRWQEGPLALASFGDSSGGSSQGPLPGAPEGVPLPLRHADGAAGAGFMGPLDGEGPADNDEDEGFGSDDEDDVEVEEDEEEEDEEFDDEEWEGGWEGQGARGWGREDGVEGEGGRLKPPQHLRVLTELLEIGQEITVAVGGQGGSGNAVTRSPSRSRFRPMALQGPSSDFTRGTLGSSATLLLELKMLADVGLVGMPNAGKSSLLRALTGARAKVGSYAFTTLHPQLGAIPNASTGGFLEGNAGMGSAPGDQGAGMRGEGGRALASEQPLVLADIPGLISGAHKDRGRGNLFLRHVERVGCIAYVLDLSGGQKGSAPLLAFTPAQQLVVLQEELQAYRKLRLHPPAADSPHSSNTTPLATFCASSTSSSKEEEEAAASAYELVVANKVDACTDPQQALADLKEATPLPIIPVSALHCAGLERLAHALKAAVHAARSRTS